MSHSYLTPLKDACLFKVTGPDALTFLQGQLSADIAQLENTGHSLAAHCNIKGRMVGLFRVMRVASDTFWLRVNAEIAETAFANLKKYSIFSKVELSFIPEASGFGASTDRASDLAKKLSADQNLQPFVFINDTAFCVLDHQHVEIWTTDQHTVGAANTLQTGSTENWIADTIKAALPDLRLATQDHFIPQMCNLQAINGVSFTKGCYTGQEIVTRLQHRGILKKAMHPFELNGGSLPNSGDAILDNEDNAVGEVVLACDTKDQALVLAVIQHTKIVEDVTLKTQTGGGLKRLPLPYELDPKLFESKR